MNSSWPLILKSACRGQQSGEPQTSLHTRIYVFLFRKSLSSWWHHAGHERQCAVIGWGLACCLSLYVEAQEDGDLWPAESVKCWTDVKGSVCQWLFDELRQNLKPAGRHPQKHPHPSNHRVCALLLLTLWGPCFWGATAGPHEVDLILKAWFKVV